MSDPAASTMRLILRQYLASLSERGELDSMIPDLLSQLGLRVFTRPGRGTRQYGVDVGAVGRIGDAPESVYLFTIKAGDLTRRTWDGDEQAVRPSLEEIRDVYIPTHLPPEHRELPVVICVCIGGEIKEPVRLNLSSYESERTTAHLTYQEWTGDELASRIESAFLREELLPAQVRPNLRKALALLDEPAASARHFKALVRDLTAQASEDEAVRLIALRQLALCLWVLYAWCREAGNMESAYQSADLALLHGWNLLRASTNEGPIPEDLASAFRSIFEAYIRTTRVFLQETVLPHTGKRHGLSFGISAASWVDVNLGMFDLIGRLATAGIWRLWAAAGARATNSEVGPLMEAEVQALASAIAETVMNNPCLFAPVMDEHVIDISLAALVLCGADRRSDVVAWLQGILDRSLFALRFGGPYPCTLHDYADLLEHPARADEEYRTDVTAGSVMYPMIALWCALLGDHQTFERIATAKRELLAHCHFQLWYPDDESEASLYTGGSNHGGVLTARVEGSPADFMDQVFREADRSPGFRELSAIRFGWEPLVAVACRHHRLPVPVNFLEGLRPRGDSPAVPNAESAAEHGDAGTVGESLQSPSEVEATGEGPVSDEVSSEGGPDRSAL